MPKRILVKKYELPEDSCALTILLKNIDLKSEVSVYEQAMGAMSSAPKYTLEH